MALDDDLAFRDATPDDLHCAECDFLASLRKSRDAGLICRARWDEAMRPEIQRLLRPPTRVLVAFNPDMPAESKADIYGWLGTRQARLMKRQVRGRGYRAAELAVGPPLVVWVYVKSHWRGRGFARRLFAEAGMDPLTQRFDFLARSEMLYEPTEGREALIKRMPGARWAWREGRKDAEESSAARPRPRDEEAGDPGHVR